MLYTFAYKGMTIESTYYYVKGRNEGKPVISNSNNKSLESRIWEAGEYRPIMEIVEELNALEEEAKVTDAEFKTILKRIRI